MTGQLPFPEPEDPFDRARRERDEGIARADDHAEPEWRDLAWAFLTAYLERHPTMFADDLWTAGLPKTGNNRALGPLIMRAAKLGLIVKTGDYRPSVSSHLNAKPVWRSLVYR